MAEQPPEDSIFFVVPEPERSGIQDIANEYAIQINDEADAGCIIWGKYRGQWHANVSARWLVMCLLKSRNNWKHACLLLHEIMPMSHISRGNKVRIAARIGMASVFDEDHEHASENSTDAQNQESED